MRVTAANPAGETAEFTLGSAVPGADARYLRAGERVFTVKAEYAELFDAGFTDLLRLDAMPDLLPSELVSLLIEHDGFSLELLYDETGRYESYEDIFTWYVGRPYAAPTAADTRRAHALFYDVTGLYIYGCAAYRPESMAEYGFDAPLCRITLRWLESGEERTTRVTLGGVTQDGYVYVRFGDSDEVLLANASIARQIAQTVPSDLLPRQVCGVRLGTVTGLRVTAEGSERVFSGEALETPAFRRFYEALTELTSQVSAPDTVPGTPVFSAVFERSTAHDAHMTLAYYPYDDAYYLASFDGRKNQLVERRALDAVLELYAALP